MSQKGSSYERKFARMLTKWITGVSDPVIFWRTGGSGSVATIAKKMGLDVPKDMIGDICSLNEKSKFVTDIWGIELKCGYGFRLDDLLIRFALRKNQKNELHENHLLLWWKKIKEQSLHVGKNPLLIMKKDFHPEYIMFDGYTYNILEDYFNVPNIVLQTYDLDEDLIYVCLLEEWLRLVDPHVLKEYVKNL